MNGLGEVVEHGHHVPGQGSAAGPLLGNSSDLQSLNNWYDLLNVDFLGQKSKNTIQSTTSITDFLVVDKSSVILVKRPKIR